ncbi:TIGR02453 family protein [Jannaschia faecimaris]|uniref:TIGR02453 family protein n=1 Tax=Jannaschia faecimaris TaxID=1244108 RepID=A0A1H3IUZ0_9RHOB|nr:DUF2461 domain-containing protein [Jannaschia faecimaris]SDY31520.1 TIGR02453 family protein [Jannaschia faecimaris]
MSDGFTQMLDRAQAFYGQLARNNSKDWFEPRKDQWKTDIEGPAKLFTELMAEEISRITGDGHTGKVFRIYRDVRFSKDKSPLKTRLAMTWRTGDAVDMAPVFYFAIEPAATLVACGVPGFAGEALRRYRVLVDTWGDQLADVITQTGAEIADIGPDPLKRVPKPYDQDHPHADLMRRKSLALSMPLVEGWRDSSEGLLAALTDRIEALAPFRRFLADRL